MHDYLNTKNNINFAVPTYNFKDEKIIFKNKIGRIRDIEINSAGEIFLINSHIPSYKESSYNNHDPKRNRKLLLNKREINKMSSENIT